MMVPTVHLNGTSKDALLEQIENAHAAVRAAMEALAQAAPNGRDYYPQGADAIYKAQDEHNARMRKLNEVKTELEVIAESLPV